MTDDNNSIPINIPDNIPDNSQLIYFVVSDRVSNKDALSNTPSNTDDVLTQVRKNTHKE